MPRKIIDGPAAAAKNVSSVVGDQPRTATPQRAQRIPPVRTARQDRIPVMGTPTSWACQTPPPPPRAFGEPPNPGTIVCSPVLTHANPSGGGQVSDTGEVIARFASDIWPAVEGWAGQRRIQAVQVIAEPDSANSVRRPVAVSGVCCRNR